MDKLEVLSNINGFIVEIKLMKPFKGRADLIKKLVRLYDMVDLYKSSIHYNSLCFLEAELLFNSKVKEIESLKKGG